MCTANCYTEPSADPEESLKGRQLKWSGESNEARLVPGGELDQPTGRSLLSLEVSPKAEGSFVELVLAHVYMGSRAPSCVSKLA